jgi:hypothetical protein
MDDANADHVVDRAASPLDSGEPLSKNALKKLEKMKKQAEVKEEARRKVKKGSQIVPITEKVSMKN